MNIKLIILIYKYWYKLYQEVVNVLFYEYALQQITFGLVYMYNLQLFRRN